MINVRINRKGALRVASGHPWIFSSDVTDRGEAQPGDTVAVIDPGPSFWACALSVRLSQITLRMLADRAEPSTVRSSCDASRTPKPIVSAWSPTPRPTGLMHGEADQLPGLVIDRYGDYFTIQTLDQGMDRAKADIVSCLEEFFAPRGLSSATTSRCVSSSRCRFQRECLRRSPGTMPVRNERPALQRRPSARARRPAFFSISGRTIWPPRRMLAAGHWIVLRRPAVSHCIWLAQCESVEAVDSSEAALKVAEANRAANAIGNVDFREADVFEVAGRLFVRAPSVQHSCAGSAGLREIPRDIWSGSSRV